MDAFVKLLKKRCLVINYIKMFIKFVSAKGVTL